MQSYVEGQSLGGKYRLSRCLGSGGFASVWLAADRDERPVALKILHPEQQESASARRRLADEVRILGQLTHRNIPRLIDSQLEEIPCYFVMEYVPGQNLRGRLQQRAREDHLLPLRGVAWILAEVASAVSHAHSRGVIHRDLKPANVAVNSVHQRPLVKVLDFGAAKTLLMSADDRTTQGRVVGSPLYMAPEQLIEGEITPATDVFALGVILFELLTLRRAWALDANGERLPFHQDPGPNNQRFDVLERIVRGVRPKAGRYRPELPPSVDEILASALAPRASQRYASLGELEAAFKEALFQSARDTDPDRLREATLHSMITERQEAVPRPSEAESSGEREALKRAVTEPRGEQSSEGA